MEKEKEKTEEQIFAEMVASGRVIYNPNIRDCRNDINVIRKRERAKEVLSKIGIPEYWK